MDRESAEKINEYVEEIIDLANEILLLVNNASDDESRTHIQWVLARVVTDLDLDILEPIYKNFPHLRPPDMEELR